MMEKIFITISLSLMLLLASCSSYQTMVNANDNVKNVSLGMTKEQVIAIMGQSYRLSGVSSLENGGLKEAIWYPATQKSIFFFTFEADKLIEWHERFILSPNEEITE